MGRERVGTLVQSLDSPIFDQTAFEQRLAEGHTDTADHEQSAADEKRNLQAELIADEAAENGGEGGAGPAHKIVSPG